MSDSVAQQAPLSMRFPSQVGAGSHSLLQGIFPVQGSNLGLLHCRQILYCLNDLIQTFYHTTLALCSSPYTVCGVCFCLNKYTSYLVLCLLLNSFCYEASRLWAPLGSHMRCAISEDCGVWPCSSPGHVGSSPKQDFGWVRVPTCEFKSQSEVNSFCYTQNSSR